MPKMVPSYIQVTLKFTFCFLVIIEYYFNTWAGYNNFEYNCLYAKENCKISCEKMWLFCIFMLYCYFKMPEKVDGMFNFFIWMLNLMLVFLVHLQVVTFKKRLWEGLSFFCKNSLINLMNFIWKLNVQSISCF